jgi:GntR family transcriptional regulator
MSSMRVDPSADDRPIAKGALSASDLLGLFRADRTSPIPLYFQMAERLEEAIESGVVPPGTRFANEVQLAADLDISRPTVRRAMEYLVDRGLLVRRRGIGTEVVKPRVRRPLELTSLYDDLLSTGQRPATVVLLHEQIEAPVDVATFLGVAEGTPVIKLIRLRSASGQPVARLTNYVPAALLDLDPELLEEHGLYQLLRAAGVSLHAATQSIGARRATAEEARSLEEPRGAALLTMDRVVYDVHGAAVEFGSHIYAASRYSFELSLLAH